MTANCFVGPFTYHHINPPKAFNPEFDPRAYDWSTLATYDTIMAGMYENGSDREAIAAYRLSAYHRRKRQGTPNKKELEKAKRVIYERG